MKKKTLTLDELQAQLPFVLKAPKDNGVVETLCYRPDFGKRIFPNDITVIPNQGVVGDRWKEKSWLTLENGEPDPRNQICILGKRVLDCVWVDRDNTPHPGDTIITDMDFSEANLPTGSLLKVGETILEVSDYFNNACGKWHQRYGQAAYDWINISENIPMRLRGVLCKVIQGGKIVLGDRLIKM